MSFERARRCARRSRRTRPLRKRRHRREKPSPRRTAELLRDVAAALEFAHQAGIVHRDVKPENVIVDREGRPHLMDFGLARDVSGDRVTVTGTILGTPVYMSPE